MGLSFGDDNVLIHVGIDDIVIETVPTSEAASEMADRVLDLIWPPDMR